MQKLRVNIQALRAPVDLQVAHKMTQYIHDQEKPGDGHGRLLANRRLIKSPERITGQLPRRGGGNSLGGHSMHAIRIANRVNRRPSYVSSFSFSAKDSRCRCHGACQAAESQQPDSMNIMNYSLKTAPTALSKEQKNQNSPKAKRIVIGVDVHLKSYQAARKIDNGVIGVVAKFRSQSELLLHIEKQLKAAAEVVVV